MSIITLMTNDLTLQKLPEKSSISVKKRGNSYWKLIKMVLNCTTVHSSMSERHNTRNLSQHFGICIFGGFCTDGFYSCNA